MAGDWIKWEKGLTWKPEVISIAARLGIDRRMVAGALMEFWEWTDSNMADRNGPSVTDVTLPSLCDRLTLVTGLGDAMVSVGWIRKTEGGYELPNWERHNGSTAKARACGAKRAKTHRQGAAERNGQSVTPVTVAALPEKRREEKRIQEDTPNPPQGAGGLPDMTGWEHLTDPQTIAGIVRRLTTAEPSMAMLACWKAAMTDLAARKADPEAIGVALAAFEGAEPKYRGTLPEARRLNADWFLGLVTKYAASQSDDVRF